MTATTAGERLAHALERAAERGDTWPCRDHPGWTSEDIDERRQAADGCASCPVSSLCAAAALEDPPVWGVWHGVDYGDREQRKAAIA